MPFPTPDGVAYQGQWGAYTDIENRGLFLRGDYYSAEWCRWLTRRSAGVNEYSGKVNPSASGEVLRATVDALSLLPVLGLPADVVSALLSLKDRDYVGAALAVGGIFFEGFDAARIGRRAANVGKLVFESSNAARLGRPCAEAILRSDFTRSNFRKNLQKLTGKANEEIKDKEAHHVFPASFLIIRSLRSS